MWLLMLVALWCEYCKDNIADLPSREDYALLKRIKIGEDFTGAFRQDPRLARIYVDGLAACLRKPSSEGRR